jgi:hypothetical protein
MFLASGGSPIFCICATADVAAAAAATAMMARAQEFPLMDWFSLLSFPCCR